MICRKCGATLPDDIIRCTNCGIKVNMFCPECKTLVPFGEKYCSNCGFQLIKICPSCHCSNAYYAQECRKCGAPLVRKKSVQTNIEPEQIQENISQPEVVEPISSVSSPIQYTEIPVSSDFVYEAEPQDEQIQEEKQIEEAINTQEPSLEQIPEQYKEEEAVKTPENPDETEVREKTELKPQEQEYSQEVPLEDESENVGPSLEEDTFEEYPEEETYEEDEEETAQETEDEESYEDNPQTEETEPIQEKIEPTVKKEAVEGLINLIKNSINKHIIAITGTEGSGKTAVLMQTKEILNNDGYMCLYGGCSPLSQITSYGFFQDAFLRLLGFPPYRNSIESFMKDFKKSQFNDAFSFLQPAELSLFLNLLYPTQKDNFENILENKELMFSILEKIIKTFISSTNMVIIVDNFDLLDGASYDFINYIAGKNFFNSRLKLLVSYQEEKSVSSYFDYFQTDDIFETIRLEKFALNELPQVLSSTIGINIEEIIPSDYLERILKKSNGNAIHLEQEIAYLFDANYLVFKDGQIFVNEENKPETETESLEDLIKLRLTSIPAEVKNVLYMAAILGYRFATDILCHAPAIPLKKALNIIELLKNELFIVPVDDFTYEFKSLAIWKLIYKEAQNDSLFKENSERIYNVLKSRVLSSNIQKLISCAEAIDKKEEFVIWQDTANITAKLGDTNLYVIAQKQCLKILEEYDMPNADEVREIIYEQIGKLLSKKSPAEAIGYLANVLDSKIKDSDTNKIVDLSGYFINSCYLTGNYFGVSEAVDAVVKNLEDTDSKVSDIQLALIKTRKLDALLNIGNTEQLINLIKEDILPKINEGLSEKQNDISYKNLLTDAWLVSNITLAKAYAIQGNHEIFGVIASVKDFIENNQYKSRYYLTKISLVEALAHTTKGETSISYEILNLIKEQYKDKIFDKKILCEWNLIHILNKVFEHKLDGLKQELFELAEFSNNINEFSVKNIVKLILGYIIKEEGNITNAISIYNDEITYFAKEKIALGALLSWALIARAGIDMGDVDMALNTATKALEVAKGPKINNFFFIIYFQKLMAECYLIKGDLIAVKMYIEKALMLAKQENLKHQLVYLYMSYGKYMEEYMSAKQTFSEEYIKLTLDVYNKAVAIAKELKISYLADISLKVRSQFRTFCQLNAIDI